MERLENAVLIPQYLGIAFQIILRIGVVILHGEIIFGGGSSRRYASKRYLRRRIADHHGRLERTDPTID